MVARRQYFRRSLFLFGDSMIERIIPRDETHWKQLRLLDITSTEVSALFGLSPYATHFETFHRKRDQVIINFAANARMKWGTRLQNSIAAGIAEDNGWQVREMKEYVRDPETRMGSSFDFAVVENLPVTPEASALHSLKDVAILEIKNVDGLAFRNGWEINGDDIEAPAHIELQVQHQLALTGLPVAYIGALIGGNEVKLLKREPDKAVIAKIIDAVKKFWESIRLNCPPAPDFARDAEFISKLYSFADPGKIVPASESVRQLAETYKHFGDMEKEAKAQKDAAKAEILTIIGDAEKCKGETFTISASVIGPSTYEVNREAYRTFKINWRKVNK
jgi:predicted phage-related endonuclease